MKKTIITTIISLSLFGCGRIPITSSTPSVPSPVVVEATAFDIVSCALSKGPSNCSVPIPNATVKIQLKSGDYQTLITNSDGYVLASSTLPVTRVVVSANGYNETALEGFQPSKCNNGCHNIVVLTPTFPSPPSRDEILSSTFMFQGEMIHQNCIQPNDLPFFDVATYSVELKPCHEEILAQKKVNGDKIVQIAFSGNNRSVYDEGGQPFQQTHYIDYEHNTDLFVNDVADAISHGFFVWVYFDGDGNGDEWKNAYRQWPIAYYALHNSQFGDLTRYVVFRPGWDGVFYGWGHTDSETRQLIKGFGVAVRNLCPDCYLAIEFNTGHIPIGEGPSDYQQNGDMTTFDVLDVEFNDSNIHDDNTWQILGRLLGPNYKRPVDQVGDPTPPNYLGVPTPRGRWYVNCFEYAEYEWVRSIWTTQQIQNMRDYLKSVGCYNLF